VAIQAKERVVLVFRGDKVVDCRVVGIVAGEARDGRGVFAKDDVETRYRMPVDGMIELMSLVEFQVNPGTYVLEGECGAPRERESASLSIYLHETTDVASHTNVLRRSMKLGREITGVRRVAEDAMALLVRWMLDRIGGERMAIKAELGRGEERVM
jgi:hypothetical protein